MRFGYAAPAILALIFWQGPIAAQTHCSEFTGRTVTTETFAEVRAKIGSIAPKGEYETTAQYQARMAQASPGGRRIIAKGVEDRKYFVYDADTGMLRIQSYAFQNKIMDF